MKRETFTYKYRSVMGIDVSVTRELARGESRTKAIAKVKEDFRNSCSPLVELDGQQIVINDFLQNEILRLEVDRDRLNNLIDRFKRENVRRHPHLVKKCFVVKTSDLNYSDDPDVFSVVIRFPLEKVLIVRVAVALSKKLKFQLDFLYNE